MNNKPRPTQAELERLGRALRTLSGSNRALLRAVDEASLLQEVCRVVVETAGYRAAMVGRAEHDPAQTLTVLAQIGFGDVGTFTWSDTERGRSTAGTAIRTGAPCMMKDARSRGLAPMWREFARKHGFGSLLSLPLRVEGTLFGSLTIAAPEADAFDDNELRVLSEAADDLAFGLETLRLRQRRQQAEREIGRLNRALQARAAVNLALALSSEEPALLSEVCRAVVEECGYRLAWVAYVANDDERTLRPTAWAGSRPADEGFVQLRRTWSGTQRARRMSESLLTGTPWVVRNLNTDPEYPFHEQAHEHHLASMIILPLRVDADLVGSLYILAAEVDAFDEKELQLLTATARDLGYGLGALRARARAAVAEQEVKRLAHFDPVTGLPNRMRLRELLGDAIATGRSERRPVALLRVESEGFREINEVLGDRELEGLACEIARRLQNSAGPSSMVARTADGEFAVVVPRAGADQAMQIAQKIAHALTEPVDSSGLLLDARSSIGISMFPGHGAEPDALLRRSSVALNEARRSGAGIALFQEGLDRQHAQRLALMGDLRQAIEQDQLLLYCQPKLRIASGELCGAEALVRWRHPRLGLVQPGEFIKLAESAGLITPLTYWVMDAAMRQTYEWREQGLLQPLSVNLSARDLRDPKLFDRIAGSLSTWGAQAGSIEFELTESALMEDPAGALETLTRLKRLEVDLTIDDYGTGYSSLSYLQRLPVDAIKIDQSFVVNMLRNRDSATIVRSTIELAHNLDLSVIAEGVEDRGIFDQLAELGCDIAQGFCIGHPIPADQFRIQGAGLRPATPASG